MRRHSLGTAVVALALSAAALALALFPAPCLGSEKSGALDHPAIREVLAMVEADVGDAVILARIRVMEEVPVLTGHDLAELKRRGVSDEVLASLVACGGRKRASAPAPGELAPADEPAGRAAPRAKDMGRVRVLLEPSFGLSYAAVRIDGETVAARGQALTGRSERAQFLARPDRFGRKKPVELYEGSIEPGEHRVEVGYAVTEVVDEDPEDVLHEYTRERYRSAGVGLTGSEIREDSRETWTDAAPAVCRVKPGQVCEVRGVPSRRSPTRAGGYPVYELRYRVEVR